MILKHKHLKNISASPQIKEILTSSTNLIIKKCKTEILTNRYPITFQYFL